jgi:hypothetical protein
MKRPVALFAVVLALGAIIFAPRAGAQAQDARQEGPTEIEKCQTISQPGSYKLVHDITFTGTTGACLLITADFVTIDLAGFTISGPGLPTITTAILGPSASNLLGIAVRNGSISNFTVGVGLGSADGSIVEGLRIFGGNCPCLVGIAANGIVKGNTVLDFRGEGEGTGIDAAGTVTGNYVARSQLAGMQIGQGSTVIGNTSMNNDGPLGGIVVSCPSNVTDNTAVNNAGGNLVLNGNGCNNTNNVAP